MATGALDANGIWQYGEDDNEPTFSGMLNKLASSTSTTVTRLENFTGITGTLPVANGGTGAITVATAQTNLRVGLVPISPSTVTAVGTGATASANALGRVTFATCNKVQLADVFSSAYQHYKVVFDADPSAAGTTIAFRLMTGTSTEAATNYRVNGTSQYGTGAVSNYASTSSTLMPLGLISGDGSGAFTIMSPNTATRTKFVGITSGSNGTNDGAIHIAGNHETASAYTGLSLLMDGAYTISGTIQIFGMN